MRRNSNWNRSAGSLALLAALALGGEVSRAQAELPPCEAISLAGSVWPRMEGQTGWHLDPDQKERFPQVNRRERPDRVAWLVDKAGFQDVAVVRLKTSLDGVSRVGRVRYLYTESLANEDAASGFSLPTRRVVREVTWAPDGRRLLVISSLSQGQVSHQTHLFDLDDFDQKKFLPIALGSPGAFVSNFHFLSDDVVVFTRPGTGLVRRSLSTQIESALWAGDIYDPVSSSGGRALYYFRYEDNDPGIYRLVLGGAKPVEEPILNLPGTSEVVPKILGQSLAFISNHGSYDSVTERRDLQRQWHLYLGSAQGMSELPPPLSAFVLEDNDYREPKLRKNNVFIGHGGWLYFRPQVSRNVVLRVSYDGTRQQAFCVGTDGAILSSPTDLGDSSGGIRPGVVESFDLFTSGRALYLIVSAGVEVMPPEQRARSGGITPSDDVQAILIYRLRS